MASKIQIILKIQLRIAEFSICDGFGLTQRPTFRFQFFARQWQVSRLVAWPFSVMLRLVSWPQTSEKRVNYLALFAGHWLRPVCSARIAPRWRHVHATRRASDGKHGVLRAHESKRPLRPTSLFRNQLLRKLCQCWMWCLRVQFVRWKQLENTFFSGLKIQ